MPIKRMPTIKRMLETADMLEDDAERREIDLWRASAQGINLGRLEKWWRWARNLAPQAPTIDEALQDAIVGRIDLLERQNAKLRSLLGYERWPPGGQGQFIEPGPAKEDVADSAVARAPDRAPRLVIHVQNEEDV